MEKQFLTTKYYIKGKIFNFFEKLIPYSPYLNTIEIERGYKLINWIKRQDKNNLTSLGFFTSLNNQKVVVKILKFKLKNLAYEQLVNEANMLKLLLNLSKKMSFGKILIKFPEVYNLIIKPNQLTLVSEFVKGDSLYSKSDTFKIEIIKAVLESFSKMSLLIDMEISEKLPKRTYLQILISFPFYMLKVITNDFKNLSAYIKLFFLFYKNYLSLENFRMKYSLAHKDLHSNNILINGNSAIIIDPEVCVLADEVTDIAHIARYYSEELSANEMDGLLKYILENRKKRKNFIALTIYYSIQMMAIRTKDNLGYMQAKNYLFKYFEIIHKKLFYENKQKKYILPSVSIGIPVYNEASNISFLLESILRQNQTSYVLEKIIVVCDGTTDGTDKKVLEMAKKYPIIALVNDGKGKGKVERLMELYKMNKSDLFFTFDGDLVLATADVIDNMTMFFDEKDVAIVGGNIQPISATSFVEKLINRWFSIWFLVRSSYNYGDNVYSIAGGTMGLKKDFAKSIVFPKHLVSEGTYIYFYALSKHAKFRFAKNAVVVFQSPKTLNDYLLQTRRSTPFSPKLSSIFGDQITEKYKIPVKYKAKAILTMMVKDPIFTIASVGFNFLSKSLPYENTINKNGKQFKRVESTKKAITVVIK